MISLLTNTTCSVSYKEIGLVSISARATILQVMGSFSSNVSVIMQCRITASYFGLCSVSFTLARDDCYRFSSV